MGGCHTKEKGLRKRRTLATLDVVDKTWAKPCASSENVLQHECLVNIPAELLSSANAMMEFQVSIQNYVLYHSYDDLLLQRPDVASSTDAGRQWAFLVQESDLHPGCSGNYLTCLFQAPPRVWNEEWTQTREQLSKLKPTGTSALIKERTQAYVHLTALQLQFAWMTYVIADALRDAATRKKLAECLGLYYSNRLGTRTPPKGRLGPRRVSYLPRGKSTVGMLAPVDLALIESFECLTPTPAVMSPVGSPLGSPVGSPRVTRDSKMEEWAAAGFELHGAWFQVIYAAEHRRLVQRDLVYGRRLFVMPEFDASPLSATVEFLDGGLLRAVALEHSIQRSNLPYVSNDKMGLDLVQSALRTSGKPSALSSRVTHLYPPLPNPGGRLAAYCPRLIPLRSIRDLHAEHLIAWAMCVLIATLRRIETTRRIDQTFGHALRVISKILRRENVTESEIQATSITDYYLPWRLSHERDNGSDVVSSSAAESQELRSSSTTSFHTVVPSSSSPDVTFSPVMRHVALAFTDEGVKAFHCLPHDWNEGHVLDFASEALECARDSLLPFDPMLEDEYADQGCDTLWKIEIFGQRCAVWKPSVIPSPTGVLQHQLAQRRAPKNRALGTVLTRFPWGVTTFVLVAAPSPICLRPELVFGDERNNVSLVTICNALRYRFPQIRTAGALRLILHHYGVSHFVALWGLWLMLRDTDDVWLARIVACALVAAATKKIVREQAAYHYSRHAQAVSKRETAVTVLSMLLIMQEAPDTTMSNQTSYENSNIARHHLHLALWLSLLRAAQYYQFHLSRDIVVHVIATAKEAPYLLINSVADLCHIAMPPDLLETSYAYRHKFSDFRSYGSSTPSLTFGRSPQTATRVAEHLSQFVPESSQDFEKQALETVLSLPRSVVPAVEAPVSFPNVSFVFSPTVFLAHTTHLYAQEDTSGCLFLLSSQYFDFITSSPPSSRPVTTGSLRLTKEVLETYLHLCSALMNLQTPAFGSLAKTFFHRFILYVLTSACLCAAVGVPAPVQLRSTVSSYLTSLERVPQLPVDITAGALFLDGLHAMLFTKDKTKLELYFHNALRVLLFAYGDPRARGGSGSASMLYLSWVLSYLMRCSHNYALALWYEDIFRSARLLIPSCPLPLSFPLTTAPDQDVLESLHQYHVSVLGSCVAFWLTAMQPLAHHSSPYLSAPPLGGQLAGDTRQTSRELSDPLILPSAEGSLEDVPAAFGFQLAQPSAALMNMIHHDSLLATTATVSNGVYGSQCPGQLFVRGSNDTGCLGLGFPSRDVSNSTYVTGQDVWWTSECTILSTLKDYRIDCVAAGPQHVLAVSDSGILFGWGSVMYDAVSTVNHIPCNNGPIPAGWDLGILHYDDQGVARRDAFFVAVPQRIRLPARVQRVSCGVNYSVVSTEDAKLYAWGVNDYGQLGVGDVSPRYSPTLISGLEGQPAPEVLSCGVTHTAVVLAGGQLWVWGDAQDGKVGIPSPTVVSWQGQNQTFPCTKERRSLATKTSSSSSSSSSVRKDQAFHDKGDGKLPGAADSGAFGDTQRPAPSSSSLIVPSPVRLRVLVFPEETNPLTDARVAELRVTPGQRKHTCWRCDPYDSSMILITQGALPHDTGGDIMALEEIEFLSVSCGEHHTLAIDISNMIWSWGRNAHGELGLGLAAAAAAGCSSWDILPSVSDVDPCILLGEKARPPHSRDDPLSPLPPHSRSAVETPFSPPRWTPCLIHRASFGGSRVESVYAGRCHSAAINDAGDVWTWGAALTPVAQTRFPSSEVPQCTLTASSPLRRDKDQRVVAFCFGWSGTRYAILDAAGKVTLWGEEVAGCLGSIPPLRGWTTLAPSASSRGDQPLVSSKDTTRVPEGTGPDDVAVAQVVLGDTFVIFREGLLPHQF